MHDLIVRYVEETVRHLPVKEREDVALELEAKYQDMLAGDDSQGYRENCLALGSPATIARLFRGKERYLIGPVTLICTFGP
jgi:hypothetical protein